MYTKAQQGILLAAFLGLLTAAALAGTKGDAPNYAASKVGRWERFETTVTNGRGYPDPYNDSREAKQ